jgi:hypothetical protein
VILPHCALQLWRAQLRVAYYCLRGCISLATDDTTGDDTALATGSNAITAAIAATTSSSDSSSTVAESLAPLQGLRARVLQLVHAAHTKLLDGSAREGVDAKTVKFLMNIGQMVLLVRGAVAHNASSFDMVIRMTAGRYKNQVKLANFCSDVTGCFILSLTEVCMSAMHDLLTALAVCSVPSVITDCVHVGAQFQCMLSYSPALNNIITYWCHHRSL